MLEVRPEDAGLATSLFAQSGVKCSVIGKTVPDRRCEIRVGGAPAVGGSTAALRDVWESTSFALERLQANEDTVAEEQASLSRREGHKWHLPWTPAFTDDAALAKTDKVRVAIVREEGSNGDREMAAAVIAAGMEPWDVTMSDLLQGRASLDSFRGLIFVGGFSYADVLDSAKGWAGESFFSRLID